MNKQREKLPGVVWGFSQPIADDMEEAVSGVKGQLATKVYGDDLAVLEDKAAQIVKIMKEVGGIEDLGVFRVRGQPSDNFVVDRQEAARYQINVADVQDAIQTAAGGNALTQVLQGEAHYDLVLRYLPQYRNTKEAIENVRLLSPTGERVSLAARTLDRGTGDRDDLRRCGGGVPFLGPPVGPARSTVDTLAGPSARGRLQNACDIWASARQPRGGKNACSGRSSLRGS